MLCKKETGTCKFQHKYTHKENSNPGAALSFWKQFIVSTWGAHPGDDGLGSLYHQSQQNSCWLMQLKLCPVDFCSLTYKDLSLINGKETCRSLDFFIFYFFKWTTQKDRFSNVFPLVKLISVKAYLQVLTEKGEHGSTHILRTEDAPDSAMV